MNAQLIANRADMSVVNGQWEAESLRLLDSGIKSSTEISKLLFGESHCKKANDLLWSFLSKQRPGWNAKSESSPVPSAPTIQATSTAVSIAAEAAMEALPPFMVQAGALLGIGTAISFRDTYNKGALQPWIASLSETQRADFYRVINVENPEEVRKLEKLVREAVQLIRNSGKRFGVWVEDTRSTFGASPETPKTDVLLEAIALAPASNLLDVGLAPASVPTDALVAPEPVQESDEIDYAAAYGLDD